MLRKGRRSFTATRTSGIVNPICVLAKRSETAPVPGQERPSCPSFRLSLPIPECLLWNETIRSCCVISFGKVRTPLNPEHPVHSKFGCLLLDKSHNVTETWRTLRQRRNSDYVAIPDERIHAKTAGPEPERRPSTRVACRSSINAGAGRDNSLSLSLAKGGVS